MNFLKFLLEVILLKNFWFTENENKDINKVLSIKIKDEKNKDYESLKKQLFDLHKFKKIAKKIWR